MAIREHPELFLVKPNLGQPLILFRGQLGEAFTFTFAGQTDWTPTRDECKQWLQGDSLLLKHWGQARFVLKVVGVGVPQAIPSYDGDPVSNADFQYLADFRWQFDVQVRVVVQRVEVREWPQIFDIEFGQTFWDQSSRKRQYQETWNSHAVYVDERFPSAVDELTLLHITDLHVAARNDRIPEILGEVRNEKEKQALYLKYYNFNDNLREVIAFANRLVAQGRLVVVVATGDLVDYGHDGVFAWDNHKFTRFTSNFNALRQIIIGEDGKGEALHCPIFTVLGNHDYLQHEWPLCLDMNLFGIEWLKLRNRDTFGAYNLSVNEGREYDYWWKGCPALPPISGVPKELWPNTPEIERRRYVKEHGGWDTDMSEGDAHRLGWPHFKHLFAYLRLINWDADFSFCIGPHQFVCLNSGPDRYPNKAEFLFGGGDSVSDYKEDGPHNRGITQDHLNLVEKAVTNPDYGGLIFCFTHAPLVGLHKNQVKGMEIAFEERHESMTDDLPNAVSEWLVEMYPLSVFYAGRAAQPVHKFLRQGGYPQGGTPYFRVGQRDDILNFNCADGKVREFFDLIAPRSTETCPVSGTSARRKPAVIFSGHTHYVHEFRLEGPKADSDAKEHTLYFHLDDYSGSRCETGHSLSRAEDKESWLAHHAPLLVTSGGLKPKDETQFREVIIKGNAIESMKMVYCIVPRDGVLLRVPDETVYVIYGGAPFAIPSAEVFEALGFDWNNLRRVRDTALDSFPTVPRDGTLLREPSGAIHVIYGGARFGIPSPQAFESAGFDWANVRQVWEGALDSFPTVPRDGTLLREPSGAVHVIYGGVRFGIPSREVFESLFDWANVRQLWEGALDSFPMGGVLHEWLPILLNIMRCPSA